MTAKILIGLDEVIKSPSDGHQFRLELGLSEVTKESLIAETQRQQDAALKTLADQLHEDTERRYQHRLEEAEKAHQRELDGERESREVMAKKLKADAVAARDKALLETEEERKALEERATKLAEQIQQKTKGELVLHEKLRVLQLSADEAKLAAAKTITSEVAKARSEIAEQEAEKQKLNIAEKDKQLADVRKANEVLQRKLDQRSQQLQGDVLESSLQDELAAVFEHDVLESVKTGARGGDVLQQVRTARKANCGSILWETKRAQNWSNDWLPRLAENQVEAGAELAVLVTTVMPAGVEEPFFQQGALLVVKPKFAVIAATLLRQVLLEGARQRAITVGRAEKAGEMYNFISSRQFALYMRNLMQSCAKLGINLQQEQRAMTKAWKQRQREIDLMVRNASSMVGEIMAIGGSSLKELENLETFQLPDDSEGESPIEEAA